MVPLPRIDMLPKISLNIFTSLLSLKSNRSPIGANDELRNNNTVKKLKKHNIIRMDFILLKIIAYRKEKPIDLKKSIFLKKKIMKHVSRNNYSARKYRIGIENETRYKFCKCNSAIFAKRFYYSWIFC
jgi:hypothetical protein